MFTKIIAKKKKNHQFNYSIILISLNKIIKNFIYLINKSYKNHFIQSKLNVFTTKWDLLSKIKLFSMKK